jgi:uncharacterized protein YndB with AHSA1/START domain
MGVATNRRHMGVPAARVWDVLADAGTYADWVVGANKVRGVEGEWPAVGARLHHRIGVAPLYLRDNTEVVGSDPPRKLVLEARARPLGRARIELTVISDGEQCSVSMTEVPVSPWYVRVAAPLLEPLIAVRNAESLRRLERRARLLAGI